MGGIRLRHDNQPGRVLVKTMNDAGTERAACPAQSMRTGEQCVHERRLLEGGGRVRGEASRLIYDEQIRVFVSHIELNIGRLEGMWHGFGNLWHYYHHPVLESERPPLSSPIDEYATAVDQSRKLRSTVRG